MSVKMKQIQFKTEGINMELCRSVKPEYILHFTFFEVAIFCFDDNFAHYTWLRQKSKTFHLFVLCLFNYLKFKLLNYYKR